MANIFLNSTFLLGLLLLFALQQPATLVAAGLLCSIYAVGRVGGVGDYRTLMGVLLAVSIFTVVIAAGLNQGYSPLFYLLMDVAALYAAKRFSSFPLVNVRRSIEVVFWLAVAGIMVGLAVHWGSPEPLGEIIPGSSTNGLPSYLIVLQAALAIAVLLERGRLPVLSAIAIFVVAVFGLGRGSIGVSALVVVVTILFNLFFQKKKWKGYTQWFLILFFIAFCLVVVISGHAWQAEIVDVLMPSKKWNWGMADPPRAQMLHDYWEKLDGVSLIIGESYFGTSIDQLYGGNPHNSYIRVHSYYGLPGFLLVVLSPFLVLFSTTAAARLKGAVFVMVVLTLVRAVTEPILFPTALDFLYFLYFFMFYRYARTSR